MILPTIAALRASAAASLTAAGVPSPDADAELLLGHVLGLSRGEVQARVVMGSQVSDADAAAVAELVARRAAREPLQHITGRAAFRSLELAVGPGVFVPRPETEQVVQLAIDALNASATPEPIAVDLGSGSGAIALAMATEVPRARVFAAENSPEAYPWTKRNFEESGATNAQLEFVDLAEAFPNLDGSVDVVASNPPYIPSAAVPRDPEVQLFDPEHALYGGEDGLDVVRRVSTTGLRLLHPGGLLVMEHGEEQAAAIAELLRADGWSGISWHRDLLGRDRATTAIR
ncbi:peptide chain release factor N(5)-glutamine methyltransferase [Salinibacterium sp. SYSU T00001]|uniref:peptide chain release factor N(5)-glutamine methyltransferase n=1 Tax=Homoserinimonas sedimenticola TaxID=2986805 RepID=UPI0022362A9B|nr:peptide chain release factor N(5)-glutamine methyltransferase [Salinibacterium sedimenticola]MCW4386658.1 peptide chain release factor N(5)-glutamine methyltransferase [Salinibacterium sedimenticola]